MLVALAAMVSPTTLTFSSSSSSWATVRFAPALVLPRRAHRDARSGWSRRSSSATPPPRRTPSQPKTWVAIVDVVAGGRCSSLGDPRAAAAAEPGADGEHDRPDGEGRLLAGVAILGAGAALANPGGFIPIALKSDLGARPERRRSTSVDWVFFTLVSLLPLARSRAAPRRAATGRRACSARRAPGSSATPESSPR